VLPDHVTRPGEVSVRVLRVEPSRELSSWDMLALMSEAARATLPADAVVVATTSEHYAAFGALIVEYTEWLRVRYSDVTGLIDGVGAQQSMDEELDHLTEKYGPPEGLTLLACRGDDVVGGVAYRDLHDGTCEMKRLYVPERFGGRGAGRLLCTSLIRAATDAGFSVMRLDTGFRNDEATAMYASLGFVACDPHVDYPPHLAQHIRFFERPLR
jgi:GNAT superfamily N-acetyltransferase